MRIIDVTESMTSLLLGWRGENNRVQYRFPVAEWLEEYPDATIGLYYQLPYHDDSYPVVIGQPEDGFVSWTVGANELQIVGTGCCELTAVEGETVVLSKKWKTRILESLDGGGEAPEPWESWEVEFTRLKGEAEDAADDAEVSALKSEGYAKGSQNGVPAGSDSPYYHKNAEYFMQKTLEYTIASSQNATTSMQARDAAVTAQEAAENAQAAAETAQAAAETAETGAGTAQTAAEAAQTAAETAETGAEAAQTAAEAAQAAAETAQGKAEDAQEAAESAAEEAESLLDTKADKADTVITGSLSLGRKSGTTNRTGSVALGDDVEASGFDSFAQGNNTVASGYHSSAFGTGTTANRADQHVFGSYNVLETPTGGSQNRGEFLEIVGNGNSFQRMNARTLEWDGTEHLRGDLYVNCNADGTGGDKVATEDSVSGKLDAPEDAGTQGQVMTTDGQGGVTWEDPSTPADLIDDEAGSGDTDKVWSADKTSSENSALMSAIESRIAEPETEGTSGQVLTTDGNGGRSWTTVQGGGSVTVDDALSTTSTNPVQNKVITNAINSNILVNFIAKENLTEKGWRIQTNGKPTTTASYDASKFIPVKQGMIIKYGFYCSNIASPFAFYTTDQGNPEAYYAVTGTGVNSKTEGQYTIPSDGFIRFCSSNTKPDGYLYVTNMQPDYEKTYREETDTRIDGIEESLSNSLTGLTFNTGYVDADGSIHTQTANKEIVSEPIYCLGKIDLSLSFSSSKSIWIGIGVYGANGFISRKTYSETATSKSISYELPDGAMFIKISFRTFDETYSLVLNGQYSIPVVANNIESLFDKISDAGSPAILASSLKPCYDHLFVNTYGNNIVIPCQSIYHLRISKRLGYKTIEANIYESSDGVPFVHHLEDDGTLGRYFHHVDGVTDISDIVPSTKTAEWIVENVRYNSTIEKYRTSPVLLKDFLVECKKQEMIPFVTSVNTDVISMVSGIMGKDMFVAYRASRTNCPTAIIYQWKGLSTKEDIVSYCDSVGKPMIYGMSNYNSFTDEQLIDIVETLHKKGYFIGAAYADSNWNKLSGMGFDFNGALWSANRIESGNLHNLESIFGFNDFTFTGATESGGILTFTQAGTLTPDIENKVYPLATIDVELWFNGSVTFDAIGEMKSNLTITSDGSASVYRAIAIINGSTKFNLSVASGTEIYDIKFKASVC